MAFQGILITSEQFLEEKYSKNLVFAEMSNFLIQITTGIFISKVLVSSCGILEGQSFINFQVVKYDFILHKICITNSINRETATTTYETQ